MEDDHLILSLAPDGVEFLREHWSRLRDLVCRELLRCRRDPLSELTGLPVPSGPIDGRLDAVVGFWCGTEECGPVWQVWQGWLLHELDAALDRVLDTLPERGGLVTLPGPQHPVVLEWGCMVASLHVMLGASTGRMGGSESAEERRCLEWLELVLETLVEAGKPAPARAG